MARHLILAAIALLALLAFARPAHAQTPGDLQCLPQQEGGTGSPAHTGWSLNGRWTWWWCPHADGRQRLTLIVGTPAATLRNIGDRIDTIRLAPDKLAAARASWRRHVTLPLSDPLFAAVLPDAVAHIRQVTRQEAAR